MIFFTPVIVKYMEKHLNITKPRYSEQILPVPWHFIISRSTVFRPTHNRTSSCKLLDKTHGSVVHFKNNNNNKKQLQKVYVIPIEPGIPM